VELTVGAYGKMLEDAAGIKATYIGKPSTYVFDIALDSMAIDRARVLMVGLFQSTVFQHNFSGCTNGMISLKKARRSSSVGGVNDSAIARFCSNWAMDALF
jgi:hypothetical protein